MQVWLEYEGQYIGLSRGSTVIGRAIACPIRFNDPSVSRNHLKITIDNDEAILQDLDSANGTWVNAVRVYGEIGLSNGDTVRVGDRRFRVTVCDRISASSPEPEAEHVTAPELPIVRTSPVKISQVPRATEFPCGEVPTPPFALPDAGLPLGVASSLSGLTVHHCPRCGAATPYSETVCPSCGYLWPPSHPSSPTIQITPADPDRRRETRHPVEIPVIYSSSSLTFDGIVRDLSRGGMYIASDLSDPIGTRCKLRVLPDAHGTIVFEGIVCHVVQQPAGQDGRPPGLGVQFARIDTEAEGWLEAALSEAVSLGPLLG